MPTKSDALRAWADAHHAYCHAADVLLAREKQGTHDLDVVEAPGREAQRALGDYRVARGEREA